MTTAVTFILGFFLGAVAAAIICFCALTAYFYKLGDDAQKQIYGNDKESNSETETD